MASFPPGLAGPPLAPPTAPTLSSIPTGQTGDAGQPGITGALPRLFFQAEQQLKTIARVLPTFSSDIDSVVQQLRDVLAKALSGGPPTTPPQTPNSPTGEPTARMESPKGQYQL